MASKPSTKTSWQELCKEKKAHQASLIPKEWLLPKGLVPATQLNVIDVPRTCGILSKLECEITEIDDVTELLEKLATGKYSAYQVTLSYCKRAAIAQQLVLSWHYPSRAFSNVNLIKDQLPDGNTL